MHSLALQYVEGGQGEAEEQRPAVRCCAGEQNGASEGEISRVTVYRAMIQRYFPAGGELPLDFLRFGIKKYIYLLLNLPSAASCEAVISLYRGEGSLKELESCEAEVLNWKRTHTKHDVITHLRLL